MVEFFINNKAVSLRGVSRHQDRLYKGNALTAEEHVQDAKILRTGAEYDSSGTLSA